MRQWIRSASDESALSQGCYFDEALADHKCSFFPRLLVHPRQEYAGKPFELLDWERDLISRAYGWRRPDHTKLKKKVTCFIPKKNGKTSLCVGVILMTLLDDAIGNEIFAISTTRDNATKMFDDALSMIALGPLSYLVTRKLIDVNQTRRKITYLPTRSSFTILPAAADAAEGKDATTCIVDELHAHRDPNVFNALRYSTSAQTNGLLFTISTAGLFDPLSAGWNEWTMAKQAIEGTIISESYLPVIYAADKEDPIDSPTTWQKANPSLGHTLRLDDFKTDYRDAEQLPSLMDDFQRYRLNIWANASSVWLPDDRIQACNSEFPPDAVLRKLKWSAGLDVASVDDTCAMVLLTEWEGKTLVIPKVWVNDAQAQKRTKAKIDYVPWIKKGFITQTPSETTDQDFMFDDFCDLARTYKITEIGIDRYQAVHFAQRLDGAGFRPKFVAPFFTTMNAPARMLQEMILNKRIMWQTNPVLRWMFSNCVIGKSPDGLIRPDRKKSRDKIDLVIAICIALSLRIKAKPKVGVFNVNSTKQER